MPGILLGESGKVKVAVVLVVRSGAFTWKQVGAIVHELSDSGARILGMVITGIGTPAGPARHGAVLNPTVLKYRRSPAW
jgi:hypothetical protein